MATLKDIQDAIDNKTFDPSKLSPKQRRLVDEAIKRGALKGPTTGEITQQRRGAAQDVALMEATSKDPIGVRLQQEGSALDGRSEAVLAGDLIGSITPYVTRRKKYSQKQNQKYLEINTQVYLQEQKCLITLQTN